MAKGSNVDVSLHVVNPTQDHVEYNEGLLTVRVEAQFDARPSLTMEWCKAVCFEASEDVPEEGLEDLTVSGMNAEGGISAPMGQNLRVFAKAQFSEGPMGPFFEESATSEVFDTDNTQ
jgi:hypothetical protein